MAVKIKICGVTNEEDAVWASSLGADFLGFNFWSDSSRKVSPEMAARLVAKVPPFVTPVGVFVDHPVDEIAKVVKKSGVKGVQLHGEQTPDDCRALAEKLGPGVFLIKAFRAAQASDLAVAGDYKDACRYFLIDARSDVQPGGPPSTGEARPALLGGTGQTFPWELAKDAKAHGVPVFVAGGLTPENVRDAIKVTEPFGVDVASGVEKSPKRKDYDKLKTFIEQAKRA